MDCLNNYIGIQGCGAPIPSEGEGAFSGLYINQLPGINLEVIENIADHEQETYLGVWTDVQLRGIKKFYLSVKAEINKCFRIVDKETVECLICENKELLSVALWYFLGVELMIERTSSTRLNRFTTIDLQDAESLKASLYTEFQASLSDAVQTFSLESSDCLEQKCVERNETVRWRMQTP